MANPLLTRILITLTVSTINLFFKIKKAKVNKILKRAHGACKQEGIVASTPIKESGCGKIAAAGTWTRLECNKYLHNQYGNEHAADFDYLPIEKEAKSKLPQVDRYVRLYYQFLDVFYWYLLVKNICRCMLAHETFASWRYLDCFLPGRVTLNGRIIEMAPYFVQLETSGWLLWRYIIEWLTTDIRLPCVEFLLDTDGNEPYWQRQELSSLQNYANDEQRMDRSCHSTLLEYKNPFTTRRGHRPTVALYKMRPNRTRASWHSLAQLTNRCYGGAIFSGLLFVPIFFRMFLPVVFTWRGFEYNYRLCIEWIATVRSVRATNSTGSYEGQSPWGTAFADKFYSSIWPNEIDDVHGHGTYTKPKIIRELFMPWMDFVSPSYFQLLRATFDLLESMLLYVTLGLAFNSICFISILMSRDILLYCQSINVRLARLNSAAMAQMDRSKARIRYLRCDTADVQAQIADMFAMLDTYNKYMSLQSVCLLMFWISYSAMVSSWIFMPDNEGSKVDWYALHATASAYFFTMLSNMSKVRTSCHKMHELMSSAMAHASDWDNDDNDDGHGPNRTQQSDGRGAQRNCKDIWLSLLRFYKPWPLYCFRIIDSVELTVMSGLQLIAWLFGALVIASSFFQVHNIK